MADERYGIDIDIDDGRAIRALTKIHNTTVKMARQQAEMAKKTDKAYKNNAKSAMDLSSKITKIGSSLGKLNAQASRTNQALSKINKTTKDGLDKVHSSINKVNKNFDKLNKKTNETNRALSKLKQASGKGFDKVSKSVNVLHKDLDRLNKKTDNTNKALGKLKQASGKGFDKVSKSVNVLHKDLTRLNKKSDETNRALGKMNQTNKNGFSKIGKDISTLVKQMKTLNLTMKYIFKQMQAGDKATSRLAKEVNKLEKSGTATSKALNKLNTSMKSSAKATDQLAQKSSKAGSAQQNMANKIVSNNKKIAQSYKDAENAQKAFFNYYNQDNQTAIGLGQFGSTLYQTGSQGLRTMYQLGNKDRSIRENQLRVVSVDTDMTPEKYEQMKKDQYRISYKYGINGADFSKGIYDAVSVMDKYSEVEPFMDLIAKFSRGGLVDPSVTANAAATGNINFNIKNKEQMKDFLDALKATENTSGAELSEFLPHIQEIAPFYKSLTRGNTPEQNEKTYTEMLTIYGAISKTIDHSTAAVATRRIAEDFENPKKRQKLDEAVDFLNSQGYSFSKFDANSMNDRGFIDVSMQIAEMSKILNQMDEEEVEAYFGAGTFFGQKNTRLAMASLLNNDKKALIQSEANMKNREGLTDRAYNFMKETDEGKYIIEMERLTNNLDKLGESLVPALADLTWAINGLLSMYNSIPKPVRAVMGAGAVVGATGMTALGGLALGGMGLYGLRGAATYLSNRTGGGRISQAISRHAGNFVTATGGQVAGQVAGQAGATAVGQVAGQTAARAGSSAMAGAVGQAAVAGVTGIGGNKPYNWRYDNDWKYGSQYNSKNPNYNPNAMKNYNPKQLALPAPQKDMSDLQRQVKENTKAQMQQRTAQIESARATRMRELADKRMAGATSKSTGAFGRLTTALTSNITQLGGFGKALGAVAVVAAGIGAYKVTRSVLENNPELNIAKDDMLFNMAEEKMTEGGLKNLNPFYIASKGILKFANNKGWIDRDWKSGAYGGEVDPEMLKQFEEEGYTWNPDNKRFEKSGLGNSTQGPENPPFVPNTSELDKVLEKLGDSVERGAENGTKSGIEGYYNTPDRFEFPTFDRVSAITNNHYGVAQGGTGGLNIKDMSLQFVLQNGDSDKGMQQMEEIKKEIITLFTDLQRKQYNGGSTPNYTGVR